jgi:branched-chain amino acid transport system substrate-binding protein
MKGSIVLRSTTASGRRGKLLATGLTLGLLSFVGACSSSSDGSSGDGGKTYVVGFPALESGPAAFAGVPIVNGAKLAVKEINDTHFLGANSKVDLKVDDIKGDPSQAIGLYKQYAKDGAAGVLCCGLSTEAGALAPIIKSTGVPGVVTSAVLANLADPPYLYRSVLLPSEPGGMYDKTVDTVAKGLGAKTAVMVVTSDNDGMAADAKVWAAALQRDGIKVLKTINTGQADTNFTQAATDAQAANPDIVVASTLGTPGALLARALRERGYTKPMLSSYGIDSQALFKTSAGGLAGSIFFVPFQSGFTKNDMATKFSADYKAAYGTDADQYGAQGYTAMWFLAQGMKAAGSNDPKKVATALNGITSQDTVYGKVTYENGQASLQDAPSFLEWNKDGTLKVWSPS